MPRQNEIAGDLPLFGWMPPTKIVPFPSHRRADFVRRHARRMSEMAPEKAGKHLARTIASIADRHARHGVAPRDAETDCAAVRVAIEAQYRLLSFEGVG